MASYLIILRRSAVPVLLIVFAALVLPNYVLENPGMSLGPPGSLGPATWPDVMLGAVAVCAALWLASEIWTYARERRGGTRSEAEQSDEHYHYVRAVIGIGLIFLYGAAIQLIGFPLATVAFVTLWCLLGRVRRPFLIGGVSIIGTIVLLYTFVWLARMPLDRGTGVFGDVTVALFQALGIY